MPTVAQIGPFRFYFYSGDRLEPPHVHVEAAGVGAKLWLNPVSLARNDGMRHSDLNAVQSLAREHRDEFLAAWADHFSESQPR